MHIVYAGIRKTSWIFLLVPVLACILQMSAVMAFASASLKTDRRTGVEIATAGNASADRTIVETATVSDAEKLTKPREEASEESERGLTEEPLLDDLSPIASVSNAEYQAKDEALEWGKLRTGEIGVGGTDYVPPIPNADAVRD